MTVLPTTFHYTILAFFTPWILAEFWWGQGWKKPKFKKVFNVFFCTNTEHDPKHMKYIPYIFILLLAIIITLLPAMGVEYCVELVSQV